MAVSQQTANSIDIISKYKTLKSPAIPPCLKSLGDDILHRVNTGRMQALPGCWVAMNARSTEVRESKMEEITLMIDALSVERRRTQFASDDSRRMAERNLVPTQDIFAGLLEFISRCQATSVVTLVYPSFGWIIMGPPFKDDSRVPDEVHFINELIRLTTHLYSEAPVKRDMFCYTMFVLSEMADIASENCRDNPALSSLFRYQLAELFGPLLLTISCESCHVTVTPNAKTCSMCSLITRIVSEPYTVDILERMLRYVSKELWESIMSKPAEPRGDDISPNIHSEIEALFCGKTPVNLHKARPPSVHNIVEEKKRNVEKVVGDSSIQEDVVFGQATVSTVKAIDVAQLESRNPKPTSPGSRQSLVKTVEQEPLKTSAPSKRRKSIPRKPKQRRRSSSPKQIDTIHPKQIDTVHPKAVDTVHPRAVDTVSTKPFGRSKSRKKAAQKSKQNVTKKRSPKVRTKSRRSKSVG